MSYKSCIGVLQLQAIFFVELKCVADSESSFMFIDIAAYGTESDGGIFSASNLYHFLEDCESTLPKPASLREVEQKCLSLSVVTRPVL
jgi:hypothetical protein